MSLTDSKRHWARKMKIIEIYFFTLKVYNLYSTFIQSETSPLQCILHAIHPQSNLIKFWNCCLIFISIFPINWNYQRNTGENFGGRVGTIVGWGRVGVDKPSSKYLMKALLNILSDTECMNSKLSAHLKPMMMCAFSKGKDGCQVSSICLYVI